MTDHHLQAEKFRRDRRGVPVVLAFVLLALAASTFWVVRAIRSDPTVVYLSAESGAQWIRYGLASSVDQRSRGERRIWYRRAFQVAEVPREAELTLRALRDARVYLDDRVVLERREATAPGRRRPGWILAANGARAPRPAGS